MIFRIAALTTFLAATVNASKTLCFDYSDVLDLELGAKECTSNKIVREVRNAFNAKIAAGGPRCRGGFKNDLYALTGTTDFDAAQQVIRDLCALALADAVGEVETESWGFLENGPAEVNLEEFFEGNGFLNLETGNFRQKTSDYIKRGGYDRFISISEDSRLNDHYPTTQKSYQAGEAVKAFRADQARKKFLLAPPNGFEEGCASNTAMCCWGRDRQYFDGNGDCQFTNCANRNPSDNTDLCWTEHNGEVFPYPGDDTEQDLHCHGISWGDDDDINTSAKWNSLFYVSMYDHMYKRGYVESITNDPKIAGNQAMCGCIEDMAPVARADCNQVVGRTNYTAYQDPNTQLLVVASVSDTFELEFQECEGYDFDENIAPEDYAAAPNDQGLKSNNNDLAAFVFGQYLKGKIGESHVSAVERTLIGYRDPEVNKNNKERNREDACKAAFEDRYPGKEWKERKIEDADSSVVV